MGSVDQSSFRGGNSDVRREATIVGAVESVLAQTSAPSEVIVVDDGSTDATLELLRQFSDSVTLVVQPQSGSAAARNHGVARASADWIAFLDSDDRWEPDHLERMTEAIVATKGQADLYFRDTQVAFYTYDSAERQVYVGSLWELGRFEPREDVTLVRDGTSWVLLPIQPMMVQSSVVRRARYLHEKGMWPRLRLREDTHLFFKLGLGSSICAVAGVGVTMTDDASDTRLTSGVTPSMRSYWENTVLMYDDLARRDDLGGAARGVFVERLAGAHWRLARIAMVQRSPRAALLPLLRSFRTKPLFVPRTIMHWLAHTRPR